MTRREPTREPEKLLKVDEVADLLGVTTHALAQMRHRGTGPNYIKMGRSVRYRPSDVASFQETELIDPTEQRRRTRR